MSQQDNISESTNATEQTPVGLTRQFVEYLTKSGVEPASISYALAYVSTELGLIVTGQSYRIYPTVLQALTDAGNEAIDKSKQALKDKGASPTH